jgi:RNA polymerase sigma-70 factor (ECF subfamily)
MHSTPVSLLERLRKPTDDAWSQFVRLYSPLLYAWAGRAGMQEADAADLVQDVLLLLLAKLPEFQHDPSRSFRAWLRTVTLNKWRERQRRAVLPMSPNELPLDGVAGPDGSDEFWESDYRQHLVGEALKHMKDEFQPTTWKACWEHLAYGRSAADVGAELNLTPGAVRAATFRVLTRLRQHLAGMLV